MADRLLVAYRLANEHDDLLVSDYWDLGPVESPADLSLRQEVW